MSSTKKNDLMRRKKLAARRAALARRIALQPNANGGGVAVIHPTNKGYNVPMIRDFLEHLLLEVRCQQSENIKVLRGLDSAGNVEEAIVSGNAPTSAVLQEFSKYLTRYESALIAANVFDSENATDAERRDVMQVVLEKNIARREEQIGHLEALQELFEEALSCAKVPFGLDEQGEPVQPYVVHEVRKIVDDAFAANLPNYDELLPQFEEHPLARPEVIEQLKQQRLILALNRDIEGQMILFGIEDYRRSLKLPRKYDPAFVVEVRTYRELQFLVAAIQKFVGLPCNDGSPWKELLPF